MAQGTHPGKSQKQPRPAAPEAKAGFPFHLFFICIAGIGQLLQIHIAQAGLLFQTDQGAHRQNQIEEKVSQEQAEEQEKKLGIRGEIKEIGWGSQIRSYVMQPYTMVKDHRTNEETGNVSSVLDGNIDQFINAYLKQNSIQGK